MGAELAVRVLCTGGGVLCLALGVREGVAGSTSRSFGWFLSSAVAFGIAVVMAR